MSHIFFSRNRTTNTSTEKLNRFEYYVYRFDYLLLIIPLHIQARKRRA